MKLLLCHLPIQTQMNSTTRFAPRCKFLCFRGILSVFAPVDGFDRLPLARVKRVSGIADVDSDQESLNVHRSRHDYFKFDSSFILHRILKIAILNPEIAPRHDSGLTSIIETFRESYGLPMIGVVAHDGGRV
jgi:hypothetical protein